MSNTKIKDKAAAVVEVPEQSVDSFISQGIEHNLPVETMEKLFALRERVKAEQAREAFTQSISKFQGECPTIEKKKAVMNKDGSTVRYKYAPLDSIVDQIKSILADNGLSYSTDALVEEGYITAICKVTHVLGHSETSSFKVPIDKDGFMSQPQKFASALTFAKRYAFCNAFGILTGDEDNDAAPLGKAAPTLVIEDWKMKLEEVTDLDHLKKVWSAMPIQAKTELKPLQEALKKKFSNENA